MKALVARAGRLISRSACCCSSLVCLFPFAWMALSSIKTLGELYTVPPVWLPETPTLENYRKVLFDSNVPRYFLNIDGHLARLDGDRARARDLRLLRLRPLQFPRQGRPTRPSSSSASCCRPPRSSCRSSSRCAVLGLVNTYLGLILVYMILTLPLSVWMLTSYFKAIPVELEEAAIIDGASRLGVLFRITLPLSLPGIVAIVVYAFVTTWNEFIFALVLRHGLRA